MDIGRTPLSSFGMAISLEPSSQSRAEDGKNPLQMSDTTAVRASAQGLSRKRISRCSAVQPDGPGEAPVADLLSIVMSFSLSNMIGGGTGKGGSANAGGRDGCN